MKLIDLAVNHDWNYVYSDDHYHYKRGEEQESKIFGYMQRHHCPFSLLDIYNAISGYCQSNMVQGSDGLFRKKEWIEKRLNMAGFAGNRILSDEQYYEIMKWINIEFE